MHSTQSVCQLIRLRESERGDYPSGIIYWYYLVSLVTVNFIPKIPSERDGILGGYND